MKKIDLIEKIANILGVVLGVVWVMLVVVFNLATVGHQQFSLLASSFLNGRLDFGQFVYDAAVFNGKFFWPLGPLPAMLMVPANFLLGREVFQGYLQLFLAAMTGVFIYLLARRWKYNKISSWFWCMAFMGGSCYLGVVAVAWSWLFAQVVEVFLLWWWLYEYFRKEKRFWLLGLLIGVMLLTRFTLSLVGFVVIWELMSEKHQSKIKLGKLSSFLLPIILCGLLLLTYNQIRFGNFWEQGYGYQKLGTDELEAARQVGLFSWKHIPTNLYYFFLKGPEFLNSFPFFKLNLWGAAFWVTSPILLLLGKVKIIKINKRVVVAVAAMMALIFSYYGVGWRQFGYRYSLDFLPLLFGLLMKNYQKTDGKLSWKIKVVILTSILFNLYLFVVTGWVSWWGW